MPLNIFYKCRRNLLSSRALQSSRPPLKVLVSGAAGKIGMAMLPLIANGCVFGLHQRVVLHLLEVPQGMQRLRGIEMEIEDGAYGLVEKTIITDSPERACEGIDWAVLIGGAPVKSWKNFERDSLLAGNVPIFARIGKALDSQAKKTAKVLVVANPANTNALVTMEHAPSIPRENFSALTRLDHNRAISELARRLGVPNKDVQNVAILGNHSRTQYCDTSKAVVQGKDIWKRLPDKAFLRDEFQQFLRDRFYKIVEYKGVTSCISAANAAKDHIKSWREGTEEGEFVSMCVSSDGNPFGVAEGLIFSFPVETASGEWAIKRGFEFSPEVRKAIEATEKELLDERKKARELFEK